MLPELRTPAWSTVVEVKLPQKRYLRAVWKKLDIVVATRQGDVAAIAPFRYSRLVFVMFISVLFLGERPDLQTLVGAGIIVASGIYAFWRERVTAKTGPADQSA